ncbi:MAG: SCP2 sterol-binding domain-containing protein [Gammaproteobacteria bacterium]
MDLQACTEALRAKVGDASGLNATLKFDCGDDGIVFVDGKSIPNSVDNDDKDADCTVGISLDDLTAMLEGDLEPATAFMTGKLKVSGDMSVALKLQRIV